jgi:hypothetical protein
MSCFQNELEFVEKGTLQHQRPNNDEMTQLLLSPRFHLMAQICTIFTSWEAENYNECLSADGLEGALGNSIEGEWIILSLTFKTARERGMQGHAIMVSHWIISITQLSQSVAE